MKILHLNSSDIRGGAAKAAINLHESLLNENIESYFLSQINHPSIKNSVTKGSSLNNIIDIIKNGLARKICKFYISNKKETLSISIFKNRIINQINKSDCDIVNLHWICNEFIAIDQIKKIEKPIVWSLYDMWPFSGAEHYSDNTRYKNGYTKDNRSYDEKGFDVNKWTWDRKVKNFDFSMELVAPSSWLQNCSKESVIFKNNKTHKICHPINTDFWKPIEKNFAKDVFNFDKEKKTFLFFSSGITQNYRKGFDFLPTIINNLKQKQNKFNLVIVGQKQKKDLFNNADNVRYIDFLEDDESRKILYNAADLILAPSRSEAFGLVVAESGSCETPSIGFEKTGVEESILHKENGYLCKNKNLNDFTDGINWFLENESRFSQLGKNAREYIEKNFSNKIIAKKYIDIYKNMMNKK